MNIDEQVAYLMRGTHYGDQQLAEMARMLGGAHVGEQTLAHARELIARSKGRAVVAPQESQ